MKKQKNKKTIGLKSDLYPRFFIFLLKCHYCFKKMRIFVARYNNQENVDNASD